MAADQKPEEKPAEPASVKLADMISSVSGFMDNMTSYLDSMGATTTRDGRVVHVQDGVINRDAVIKFIDDLQTNQVDGTTVASSSAQPLYAKLIELKPILAQLPATVTTTEFSNATNAAVKEIYGRIDTNGDGLVVDEEFKASASVDHGLPAIFRAAISKLQVG